MYSSPSTVENAEPEMVDILAAILQPNDLARAKALSAEGGDPLDTICTRLGLCSERELTDAIVARLGLAVVEPTDFPPQAVAGGLFNPNFLSNARAIPIDVRAANIVVAMVDPTDQHAISALEFAAERSVVRRVCSATDFQMAWDRLYRADISVPPAPGEITSAVDVERLQDLASDAPVIRYVNQLLSRGIDLNASDIHLEPVNQEYRVRFRLDGLLQEIEVQPSSFGTSVVSRIKIMASLNIAERRLAQDGRFSASARGERVDLRVATTPTVHGEAVVLRILDSQRIKLDIRSLGFSAGLQDRWLRLLTNPHGILLVTGPTGSGKSTTLYAGLTELNRPDRKLLTIEDPVEQQIEGVNQVHAQPAIGFGFGAALRAFLRHDPDVIMVGEIRDLETARTAIQAALTGHLILSTLHTNDAVSGITRLLDMGIDAYLIASTVHGILAQRLVRTSCPLCRGTDKLHRSACLNCGGTGYKGRTVIGELLVVTTAMRALIERRASYDELRTQALHDGMIPLADDGGRKISSGITTLEEVGRATLEA